MNIRHALHSETDNEDHQSGDITARSERGIVAAPGRVRDGGGVEDDGWKCWEGDEVSGIVGRKEMRGSTTDDPYLCAKRVES